ncbi:hypothetical protein B0H14DRAFT_2578447 [Mycena olivaceomarginata]|nr:hypothetical protein B0H14DRAFT_2578447 [Mycena olivaceomarginata]
MCRWNINEVWLPKALRNRGELVVLFVVSYAASPSTSAPSSLFARKLTGNVAIGSDSFIARSVALELRLATQMTTHTQTIITIAEKRGENQNLARNFMGSTVPKIAVIPMKHTNDRDQEKIGICNFLKA